MNKDIFDALDAGIASFAAPTANSADAQDGGIAGCGGAFADLSLSQSPNQPYGRVDRSGKIPPHRSIPPYNNINRVKNVQNDKTLSKPPRSPWTFDPSRRQPNGKTSKKPDLAQAAVVMRWQLDHGERVTREVCASCRRPIAPSDEALDLADDNRVHFPPGEHGYDCLIRHGERWRRAAAEALGFEPEPL
jgi:hypothetical protein